MLEVGGQLSRGPYSRRSLEHPFATPRFMLLVAVLLHARTWVLPFSVTLLVSFYLDFGLRFKTKAMEKAELVSAKTVVQDDATGDRMVRLDINRANWPGFGPYASSGEEPGAYVYLSMRCDGHLKKITPAGGPPVPAKFWFHPMTVSSPPTQNARLPLAIFVKSMGKGTWSEEVGFGVEDDPSQTRGGGFFWEDCHFLTMMVRDERSCGNFLIWVPQFRRGVAVCVAGETCNSIG